MSFNFARDLDVYINGTDRVAEVTDIHIESRYETSAGLSPQLEIPYCTITLNTAAIIQQNQYVLIQVNTLAAYRDTTRWPGAITLFNGRVDQVDEVITPFGMRLITVKAYNPIYKMMTGKIDSTTVAFAHSPESRARLGLNQANVLNWSPTQPALLTVFGTDTASGSTMPAETITNTQSAQLIQQAIDCEAGAIVYAPWASSITAPYGLSSTNDVFYWCNRNKFSSWGTGTPDPAGTTYFSSNHSTSATHWCVTEMDVTRETGNKYNMLSLSLMSDATTYINSSNYAACKNTTSISYFGQVPADLTFNFNRPGTNPTQFLKAWVDNLNTTPFGQRVRSITSKALMPDGYINGILIDPYWLMLQKINVTVAKTYPGTVNKTFSVCDYYFISGQIHDITPTSWTVQCELWKGY